LTRLCWCVCPHPYILQQAHELAAAGDEAGLAAVAAQVDQAAAELWSITDQELADIRRSLEELG